MPKTSHDRLVGWRNPLGQRDNFVLARTDRARRFVPFADARVGSMGMSMGGSIPHIPVLGAQAVEFLNVHNGGIYIDGTFGAGGYTRAIFAAANCKVIGIDRDQSAIALGANLVQAEG